MREGRKRSHKQEESAVMEKKKMDCGKETTLTEKGAGGPG